MRGRLDYHISLNSTCTLKYPHLVKVVNVEDEKLM